MLPVVDVSCSSAETCSTSWNSQAVGSDGTPQTEDNELRTALESSSEGIGLYDDEDNLIVFNTRFAALHAAIGHVTEFDMRRDDLMDPCDKYIERRTVQRLMDGRSHQIVERLLPNRWRVVVWTDVTDQLRVQEQLEHALQKFHTANLPLVEPVSRRGTSRAKSAGAPHTREPEDASLVPALNARTLGTPIEPHQRAVSPLVRTQEASPAIDHLALGIAHDFNNMLTAVIGSLELLQSRLEKQPALHVAARSAWLAATRAAALASQLLISSGDRTANLTTVDVNTIIGSMDDLLRRAAGEHIRTDYRLADDLWPTRVDTHQLESALLNLVINARHAMSGKGRLTITTSNAAMDQRGSAVVSGCKPGQYVQVTVSDTGCGMTPDIKARIFEPFFTTKARGEGSGLGLSMVHDSVTQWSGAISVESEPGCGTTFRLYLPRQDTMPDDRDARASASPVQSTRGCSDETILVVEDESDLRNLAANLLEDVGYNVLKAANGDEALTVLKERDDVSLVFTDVMMSGGMTGIHLARILRKRWPHIAVLLTSGYSHDFAGSGMLGGARKIQKPYGSSALITLVRGLLDEIPSRTKLAVA
jgi:signal transduction histidine kinase